MFQLPKIPIVFLPSKFVLVLPFLPGYYKQLTKTTLNVPHLSRSKVSMVSSLNDGSVKLWNPCFHIAPISETVSSEPRPTSSSRLSGG
jgi:hypothetical protein